MNHGHASLLNSVRRALEKIVENTRDAGFSRKVLDVMFISKILMQRDIYTLSDQQVDRQINDHLSFCRFLGLVIGASVMNSTAVWKSVLGICDRRKT